MGEGLLYDTGHIKYSLTVHALIQNKPERSNPKNIEGMLYRLDCLTVTQI